jgi:hypothetical protein
LTGQPSAKGALDNLSPLYDQLDVQQSWPQVIEIKNFQIGALIWRLWQGQDWFGETKGQSNAGGPPIQSLAHLPSCYRQFSREL